MNWSDLFFDLFYVAAAFSLGVMLISAMNDEHWPRGVIYFLGMFGPLYATWEVTTYYDSRYTVVDHSHRLVEIVRFVFVGFAVLYIKPIESLADPSSVDTFSFVASILLESVLRLGLNLELYWRGQGDRRAIKNHAARTIYYQSLPTCTAYLAASVVAGVYYFAPAGEGEEEGAATTATEPWYLLSDLPFTLTAAVYVLNTVLTAFVNGIHATSGDCKHGGDSAIRENYVPHNIDYLIHRYG